MLDSIVNAFKVPELRNKILFTLAILALYRFGAFVPVPGIPFHAFADAFQDSNVSLTMLDLFTGGALSNFSVFSLGIMPYITASIIMQLMQSVIPTVGRWAKEGEPGRKKITQVTRWITLGLGLINAIGYLFLFQSPQYGVVFSDEVPTLLTDFLVVFTLVAGTACIMWMGELITQRGVGVATQLQGVRQGDEVQAASGKGQRLRRRQQRQTRGRRNAGAGSIRQRQPAMPRGAGRQRVNGGQAKLQRVVAKGACKVARKACALKCQQPLPWGAGQPVVRGVGVHGSHAGMLFLRGMGHSSL